MKIGTTRSGHGVRLVAMRGWGGEAGSVCENCLFISMRQSSGYPFTTNPAAICNSLRNEQLSQTDPALTVE